MQFDDRDAVFDHKYTLRLWPEFEVREHDRAQASSETETLERDHQQRREDIAVIPLSRGDSR